MEQSKTNNVDERLEEILIALKEGFEKTATKTELAAVKSDLRAEFDAKIEEVLITVKAGFDDTASKADLETVRTELKSEIATVKSELKSEIATVKSELKSEIATVKSELRTVQATMVTKNYLDEKLANLKGDLTQTNRALDGKTDWIISTLEDRKIISKDETKHVKATFKIFPTLPDATI